MDSIFCDFEGCEDVYMWTSWWWLTICVGIGGGGCEALRGDCHERPAVPKGRVVGDGGRVGVGAGDILVTDEVVVCVRRKCIGSCL